MSRPETVDISSGIEGWDAKINSNIRTVLNGTEKPLPIAQFDDVANLVALNPALWDRCIALADVGGVGGGDWVLYFSDGAAWIPMGRQAAFQADSAGWTDATAQTDFNALLAKLRAAFLMAAS